ncbi:metallophosphoesterase family protein [Pseudomonas oryzihabitans]|uniref:Phosphoesterase n=1 Tax=Pseudomonas oryzihabitans TaxID=47885 RepID=A0AAJ2BJM2_9PSED|nr:metallophosphoesterase family protein [Pseudomonas psychrotolerans]MDR6233605.1 putative phosphoesterase [Pseudomonas psychrotolerans]MDR6357346.1 putative phosphoesterase [Pseudomonas psychrotolerans]
MAHPYRVGLIADTHGLLRPEAMAALAGSDFILHAGDIGKPEILAALRELAPLAVVRGNNDDLPWADDIPERVTLTLAGVGIHMLHILPELDLAAVDAPVRVVISGHSHKPLIEERDGVLFVNPGSAGPRRFRLPISVGRLTLNAGQVQAEILELTS